MKGAFQSGTGNTFDSFTDGLSNTLLVGEKHVPMGKEGRPAWDCSIYDGRMSKCSSRAAGRLFPLTTDLRNLGWLFGSRHTGVVNFVFADGHVKALPERIDPWILELLAVRNDGQVIPDY
jgi:prepilin-type processing-associated H-X9-DG protein